MKILAAIFIPMLLLAGCSTTPAGESGRVQPGERQLNAALELFDAAAFWPDGRLADGAKARPRYGIWRWVGPIRVHIESSTSPNIRKHVELRLSEVAEFAGIPITIVESPEGANLKVMFDKAKLESGADVRSACYGGSSEVLGGRILRGSIYINSEFYLCTSHELMHAFGFPGHPHSLDTVLSYARPWGADAFTALDRLALRALYRGNLTPDMGHIPAMLAARQFLAEDLGLIPSNGDASHLAIATMAAAVARLHTVAEEGNVAIQMQLAEAYALGQHVGKDPARALKFWELAADQNNAEAMFRLAIAGLASQDLAFDPVRARMLAHAAVELGHGPAALLLGSLLRDGVGGAADLPEAFAYFYLAAGRGISTAKAEMTATFERLPRTQKIRANARAIELQAKLSR